MAVHEKLVVRFGSFELDTQSGVLLKMGMKLKLQGQPILILELLLRRPGELVTREEIRDHLWPADTFVDFEHSLNTAIKKLRAALGDEADTPRYIETLPRRGYRFIGDIAASEGPIAPTVSSPIPEPTPPAASETQPASSRAPTRSRRYVIALITASLILLLAAASLLGWRLLRSRGNQRIESIAVLPLANFSGDPEQEFFAEGITDELITDLAKIRELRVISRTSVMRYKDTKKSLPEIGHELGVDAIVEGSVQRSGNRVRISAQLVKTSNDKHLWAESFERDLKDVLTLRDEVARAIASKIQIELTPQERVVLSRNRTVIPEAYEAFLKGRHFASRIDLEGLNLAIASFEQTVAKDPQFALAWASLGHAYFLRSFQTETPLHPLCVPAMQKAMELDPELAEAHVNFADLKFHVDWKWDEGIVGFRHALDLDPGSVDAQQHYAIALWQLARFDDAIREMQKAHQLDPLSPGINLSYARLLRDAKKPAEAIAQLKKTIELEPNYAAPHLLLGMIYEDIHRDSESVTEYEIVTKLSGYSPEVVREIEAALTSGPHSYCRKRLAMLSNEQAPPIYLASFYVRAGDYQAALSLLEKAYQQRSPKLSWLLAESDWDPLRSDPRFQKIIGAMNLPQQR